MKFNFGKGSIQRKLLGLFLGALLCTFILCMGVGGGVVWMYQKNIYTGAPMGDIIVKNEIPIQMEDTVEDEVNKTVAIFGTDIDGFRTDVILVVNFNSLTDKCPLLIKLA